MVEVDGRILTGERVLVSFRIPRSRFWIDAEAVVARVVHGRRRGDRARAVGLCFEHLPGWQRLLLETRLRKIPVIPPADVRQAA